ncbi:MAG: DNA methyltransferase [Candidatus Binataceae bacterium]
MNGIDGSLADNRIRPEDRAVHDWYRFVLSFPPHLVRRYLDRFEASPNSCVLDPFCGTGTTLVESKRLGLASIGVERNPAAHLASTVKTDWEIDAGAFLAHTREVASIANQRLRAEGLTDEPALPLFTRAPRRPPRLSRLSEESGKLLLGNSISPLPLHKALLLALTLNEAHDQRFISHERLALAKVLVFEASNLHFGPEVGVGPVKSDAAVIRPWLNAVRAMAADLGEMRSCSHAPSTVHLGDARRISELVAPHSVDIVITSPPYPNEKDYTRTTRLESVVLGLIQNKHDLRRLKRDLVRSNTRSVYTDDTDDTLINGNKEIQRIAEAIENRRIELGKTSGFERQYARVTKLYFGGMARHLADLRQVLQPDARLAYVVGDQASYLRVMIRTGQLLAEIADSLGYQVIGIDLFRTRFATATGEALREEVLMLRWPGVASQ